MQPARDRQSRARRAGLWRRPARRWQLAGRPRERVLARVKASPDTSSEEDGRRLTERQSCSRRIPHPPVMATKCLFHRYFSGRRCSYPPIYPPFRRLRRYYSAACTKSGLMTKGALQKILSRVWGLESCSKAPRARHDARRFGRSASHRSLSRKRYWPTMAPCCPGPMMPAPWWARSATQLALAERAELPWPQLANAWQARFGLSPAAAGRLLKR